MKKSNKEFVAEFMNQLDSGKLLQLVQGLLNQEEILQNEEILVSNNENNQLELDNSNITIEKLSISEKPTIETIFMKNDEDNEETLVKWFAERAKPHFEPKKVKEVPIEQDIYGLMFTQEGKLELERQKMLKEAETFASLSREKQLEILIKEREKEREKEELIKSGMEQKILNNLNKVSNPTPVEKTRAELEIENYKAAEYRIDNNIPAKNKIEQFMMDKVKSDRLAKEINNKMADNNYQSSIFVNLQSHIQEVQKKNRELEEKETLKPQVEAIEKELDDLLLVQDIPEI